MIGTSRPTLHLSGPKLRAGLEALIAASEPVGGIEQLARALKMKSALFRDDLSDGRAATLEQAKFDALVRFMPTVRRRIGVLIADRGWPVLREAIAGLLDDALVPGTADARSTAFEIAIRGAGRRPLAGERLGEQPAHRGGDRYLRDLAAELLHNVYPEHYPLMTRWVWDAAANTGALREIWHDVAAGSDDVDRIVIDIPDTHETFLALREELSQFLSGNGIFRDMLWYVDLLCAHIYGEYINAQGGAYLKTDFNAGATDPLEHTRRILGLDGRGAGPRRRAFAIDGPTAGDAEAGGAGALPARR